MVGKALHEKISWRKAVNFFPALVTEEHPVVINEDFPRRFLVWTGTPRDADPAHPAELVVQKDEENFLVTGWL